MKKLAKRIIGTLSVGAMTFGIVLGVNALTKNDEVKVDKEAKVLLNDTWYFTGSTSDDPELASNYSLSSTGLPPCGATKEVICQIQAPNSGGQPDMNAPVDGTTVQQQIHDAQESIKDGVPTENTTVTGFRPE